MYGVPLCEEEVPSEQDPQNLRERLRCAFGEAYVQLGWVAARKKQYFNKMVCSKEYREGDLV